MFNNSLTSNYSMGNDSSTLTGQQKALLTLVGGFLNMLSFFIVVVEIASIYVLKKCVLISDQIKIISQNLLLADMQFHVMHISVDIFNTAFQISSSSGLAVRLRLGVMYTLLMIYCLIMVVAALDRFIAVRYPLHYQMMFPGSKIRSAVRVIWFVMTCMILFPYILGISLFCSFKSCGDSERPLLFNQYFRMMLSVLFLFCDILVAVLYTFILVKSEVQMNKLRKLFNGKRIVRRLPGRRIMLIFGTFVVFYSPAVIYTLIFDLFQIKTNFAILGIFYIAGFRVCTAIHSCISLYFYAYDMPECRMRFTAIFLFWSSKYRQRAEQMKMKLFSIPVVEKKMEKKTSAN